MNLAFAGGGGGSAPLILMGYAALMALAIVLLVGGIVLACFKKAKSAALTLTIAIVISSHLYEVYSDYSEWEAFQRTRKRDFDVAIRILPNNECSVTVDKYLNPSELVMLDGRITFHIEFPDSRKLTGRCSSLYTRRKGRTWDLIELGRIDIPAPDRAALLADMPLPPKGAHYDGQTETYTIWFRKQAADWEWFTCAPRLERP